MQRDDRKTGPGGRFPETRHSLIAAASTSSPELRRAGFEGLIKSYWKPVYTYLRLRHGLDGEEAKDLTQGFFTRALEKGFVERFDPARARFRTWLRLCLDGYVANERAAGARLKRGGNVRFVPLDFPALDAGLGATAVEPISDPEALFRREWIRALFEQALEDLRAAARERGKGVALALFECFHLLDPPPERRPTYAELAEEHALPVTQVTNHLAWARRQFRQCVLERLRAATSNDEDFRTEAREILGPDRS